MRRTAITKVVSVKQPGQSIFAMRFINLLWTLGTLSPLIFSQPALGSPTDISDSPIVSTTAAIVKPNVMLLMDASDSMAWTHMPDQVEYPDGVHHNGDTLVGYKSAQCNVLYYNRNTTYLIPKKPDGTLFTTSPNFNSAPYAGFVSYYASAQQVSPNTDLIDLSSHFQAYDITSLQVAGDQDALQAAYYFTYSGTVSPLSYAAAPCTDPDVSTPSTAGTFATTGGTWTKVIVSATSGVAPHVDERQNFAIWYSYYRNRISLIKSAASLAFTPLSDSFRVGFITVQPKDRKTDASINPDKYLKIGDFNSIQRNAWFGKLFSQLPAGASPAREGLARVGRYYAGLQDSINTGMSATGADDPLQYACQQNFTIMTTDGYWNTQTETPDSGGQHGGALQLDGIHKIGEADGDTTDPATTCPISTTDAPTYCPRPIWDGNAATTKVVKDASNFYDQLACPTTTQVKTIYQPYTTLTHYTASYHSTPRETQTWKQTVDQNKIATVNTTKTVTQTTETALQYTLTTHVVYEDRYQIWKSQYQSTKTTTQVTSTSVQPQSRSHQVQETLSYQLQSSSQYKLVTSQATKTTVQSFTELRRYTIEQQQTLKHVYRITSKPADEETYGPALSCTPSDTLQCLTVEISGPSAC